MPSNMILHGVNETTMMTSLVGKSGKMFPSQRHALYKKLLKSTSVGELVSTVTKFDVAEAMLGFMPPNIFKAGIAEVREQIEKLSDKELVNVVYFPNTLVSFFNQDVSHTSFYLLYNLYLDLKSDLM